MRWGRLVMGAVFISSGVLHFVLRPQYEHVMPGYLPAHRALVGFSGIAEIAGGVGLLLPATRKAAAWGIMALLIAVFPANLWMAQHPERYQPVPPWALWARLPLQLPLIWWALRYTREDAKVLEG